MRTLNKALCLVLSIVMVLGLCAFSVSAKEFVDSDKVDAKYQEAIDVLSELKVFNGNTDGTLNPKGALTRAEAATLMVHMLGADNIAVVSTIFVDVPATHWANKYVAYCQANGIIKGTSDTTFAPDALLSGTQWALMLLRALGYKESGAYELYAAKTARSAGIMGSITTLKTVYDNEHNNPFTREEAAELAFKTLTATMVDYDDSGITVTTPDGTTVNTNGDAKPYARLNDKSNYGDNSKETLLLENGGTTTKDETLQFCEQYFPTLKLAGGDTDDFVHPMDHSWTIGSGSDKKTIYNEAAEADYTGTVAASAGATITTAATDASDIAARVNALLGLTGKKALGAPTDYQIVYINGKQATAYNDFALLPGDEVEVYVDDDAEITDIIVARYTLVQVNKITDLTAAQKKNLANTDDEDAVSLVTLALATNTGTTKAVYNTRIADFKYEKDAWVLAALDQNVALSALTANTGKVIATKAPQTVSGKLDATKGTTYRINGTYYDAVTGNTTNPTVAIGTEGTWALDNAGRLAADVKLTETASSDYIYIYSINRAAGGSSDGLAATGVNEFTYTAYGVTDKGEKVSYPIAAVAGTTTATNYYIKGAPQDVATYLLNNSAGSAGVAQGTTAGLTSLAAADRLVMPYKVNEGKLEYATGTYTVDTNQTGSSISKTATALGSNFVNDSTKFVFVDVGSTLTVSTAEGYKNVSVSGKDVIPVYNPNNNTVIFAFVDGKDSGATVSSTIAVKLAADPIITEDDYSYALGVEGKETNVSNGSSTNSDINGYAIGDVFTYTVSGGVISAGKTNVTNGSTVTYVNGNQVNISVATIDITNVPQYTITIHTVGGTAQSAEVSTGATFSATSGEDGNTISFVTDGASPANYLAVFAVNTVADD